MKETQFFEKQTMSSWVKASIVSEYFPKYCVIIGSKHTPKCFRYIDLFAGPGKYEDGKPSTPLMIAHKCYQNEALRNSVRFFFNDMEYKDQLEANFLKEFPKGSFRYNPFFADRIIGENTNVDKFLMKKTHEGKYNESPSLLFIDPFGYKGIRTRVLAEFLKNWGNEIFIFLNTKRIHAALENNKFEPLMMELFPTSYNIIKTDRKYKSTVAERLQLIIDNLGGEFQKILSGTVYYTAFKFQEEDIDTTSHFIVHLTKSSRGFDLIKTIYNDFANVGTVFDGVNTYTFDAKQFNNPGIELFDMKEQNIDNLKNILHQTYSGKTLSAYDLFEEHQITGKYCRSHYAKALRKLCSENKLHTIFTDNKKHSVSVLISKDCILKFE